MKRCGTKSLDSKTYQLRLRNLSEWSAAPRIQNHHIRFNIPCVFHVVGDISFQNEITDQKIQDNIKQDLN